MGLNLEFHNGIPIFIKSSGNEGSKDAEMIATNIIETENSVTLIFSFKRALDQEDYILCRKNKDELISRKKKGEIDNGIIIVAQEAYIYNTKEYENLEMEVFRNMIDDILDV